MIPFPRPLVLGHRGSPREATENTLESLDLALRAGADGVELDIQRSRDGVPVVIHDDAMQRVWKVRRSVSRLAWPAIERLTGARLPSFHQVAAWAAASGAWLNVELKVRGVEVPVLGIIEAMGLRDRVVISSFDAEIVRDVGDADTAIRRFFLTDRWNAAAKESFARAGAEGVCLRDDGADDDALRDLRDRAIPFIAWTVNEPGRLRSLLEAGAAGVISDDPKMAASERDSLFPA